MPAPADLDGLLARIPHRPPHLALDRVLTADDCGVTVEKRVSGADVEGLWLLELSAQAAAVWNARATAGGSSHLGYLVAARGWKFPRAATAGETLTITVEPTGALGPLARFHSTVRSGNEELASGELTCAVVASPPARDHV